MLFFINLLNRVICAAAFLLSTSVIGLSENYANATGVHDLRIEHLRDPIQLDCAKPRLSWKIHANDSDRNVMQASYHVLVASRAELLSPEHADLWNSGVVESAQSTLVPYEGEQLRSRQACFWKVRITDNQGRQSAWSDIATWSMALLNPSDWAGSQWIGLKEDTRDSTLASRVNKTLKKELRSHPSPLLRKDVSLAKEIRRAMAYVCGVGYADFFINGKKVGDAVLDPGQTNYAQHTLYVVHDVTDHLSQGNNAVAFWLGNGFYGQNIAFEAKFGYGEPSVRAKLFVEYTDGSSEEIVTDESWKACVSPTVFDNVYWGESYDARREIDGWAHPGLDDSDWQMAVEKQSPCADERLRPQLLPPIKEIKRLDPVAIAQVAPDTWLFDFGKNIAGWIEMEVSQDAGDVIEILPAEVLDKATGRADQRTYGGAPGAPYELIYVCKGDGKETWSPRFTYSGFQYVEISGLCCPPSKDSVSAVFVRSDVERIGTFECSENLLNQQYAASLLSLEGNWHSLPEDCPHREKCGWLGDAHATADLSLYNYDMTTFYRKYIRDIEDSRRKDARLRRVRPDSVGVPTMVAPGKRANRIANIDWAIAYLILPWRLYVHTGDAEAFRTRFDHVKDFLAYFRSFKNKQGVIENGLGDWCPPRWDRKAAPEFMECHPYVSGTAFYYQALNIASEVASVLGDEEYSRECLAEAGEIASAFERSYLHEIEDSGRKHYGSQTATVMALKFDMVPADDTDARVAGLVFDIDVRHDGHHACGIHGLRHLYTVLADQGRGDVAYEMLTDTTFPSPGYVLSCGLTTWPERRWEWKKERYHRNSFNHPMNGGFAAFMHECLGGINPSCSQPGYKHFDLQPQLTDQIQWASATVDSPYGVVRSEWKTESRVFQWTIEIPCNTTATIFVPCSKTSDLYESESLYNEDVTRVQQAGQSWMTFDLGSGVYRFAVRSDSRR
ncbi:alfa-L-rhamnosidase [Rhodopirellula sallentina SM41]|uniref:alpha-L-rhamnosidase n=2 Tax=Rhodopirellula TaxID=265488 RepID=M5TRN3_9BACT|nr:alfa-L-rhamnosidase [Rhodopirellula sallentina SM41]